MLPLRLPQPMRCPVEHPRCGLAAGQRPVVALQYPSFSLGACDYAPLMLFPCVQGAQASAAASKAPKESQPAAPAQKEGHQQGLLSFSWPSMHLALPKQHVSYLESFLLVDDGTSGF